MLAQYEVTTQESMIAARIGWTYDADADIWYNASGDESTEQFAGYVAYECKVEYNDLPVALRLGWMEARGYDAYTSEMFDWLKNGPLPVGELDF